MESMPSACAPSSGGAYKIGHNPVLFCLTLPDTAWHQISSAYTAKNSGDLIRYSLDVTNFATSSQYLLADRLSLQR